MGKKGVILDNGKAARSSMSLYWKASQNKSQNNSKKEPHEEDIQDRAEEGKDKWKIHKQKMINKLYSKPEKKQRDNEDEAQEQQKKLEEEYQKDLLEKQMNKNKPVKIAGFKNMEQLRSKMQFQTVKVGNNASNKLIPRSPAEELSQTQIIQLLRQKKAKKQLQRAQKERIQKNLKQRKIHEDLLMNGFPEDRQHKQPEKKEQQIKEPEIIEEKPPETFFKSELLQKIQRGEGISKKQEIIPEQKETSTKNEQSSKQFASKFIPRALWNK